MVCHTMQHFKIKAVRKTFDPESNDLEQESIAEEELEEDRAAVQPGGVYPSTKDADDRTNEVNPETGKSGNVGTKYKIAREQSEIDEIANYLLETGVFLG